jgi:hypothetical protein
VEVAVCRDDKGQVVHSAIAAGVAKLLLAVCPLQLFPTQLRCWSFQYNQFRFFNQQCPPSQADPLSPFRRGILQPPPPRLCVPLCSPLFSLGGFNVNTTVNNATWKGNNFSGSGSYMGNKFTATGTFTAPSTVSGQHLHPPPPTPLSLISPPGQVCNPTRGCTSFNGQTR